MKKIRFSIGTIYSCIALLCFVFFILSFTLHGKKDIYSLKYDLTDSFSWGLIDQEEYPTENQIETKINNPLKFGKQNLSKMFGMGGHYVWLKANFNIPEQLKGQHLALFITYIHFADEVWINGHFAGRSGRFPPCEESPLYLAHSYFFNKETLNQDGENTILIKVFSHGKGEIAGTAFVSTQEAVSHKASIKSFWNTYCYMIFEGGIFITMLLYLFLFFLHNKKMEYLWFSLLNFCTMLFCSYFFIPVIPFYVSCNIPYYKLYRASMCFPGVLNFVLMIAFVRNYLNLSRKVFVEIARFVIFIIQVILLLSTKSYDDLISVSPTLFMMTLFHLAIVVYYVVRGFLIPECRHKAFIFSICLIPFVIGIIVDFIIRDGIGITTLPYMMYYGWLFTIVSFLFVLSHNHAKALIDNEYLNNNLKKEVQKQTQTLYATNERLMERIHRSNIDLQMAAIVQQKFFPYPSKNFKGWDIAVSYEPLSEVSGDFFDYYSLGINLDGFSMFDVSGHGVAASLVTMLSKSIVYNAFQKTRFYGVPVSKCLLDINHDLIAAKGSIDNYMTGIMMRFGNFDKDDCCQIDFANAGHPRPILYSAETDKCTEIVGDIEQEQFGAIGMANMEVKFRDVSFSMKKDDVLVCFTDGLSEAENLRHDQFSRQRVMDVLMEHHNKTAHKIVNELNKAVTEFVGEADRKDDITIIVLKREDSQDFLEALDSD